ncbi:Uncharacterised protein [Starkeya nomas]|uniref:DUF4345 domain-containing protein n=2 Tax=Xanthobacteraceae TaxID=335928 RepID=A0A5S9PC84_9HYPH|nr:MULTISPECIES: DUF6790 family protein [Xanthobacteraceae]TSJ60666.1 hypothetical protein FO470_18190 [Ancylobacter moscoviensis]CAA0101406.1 Uncharacterised protein [Starkeya nomas]
MVFWFPLLSWLAAIVAAVLVLLRGPRPITFGAVVDQLLRYILLFPVGVMGLWAFLGHVFFAEQAAASIGWAPSPFQFEVGMANLGIGLAGVIGAFLRSPGFRAAVGVVAFGFLGGAGVGHLVQIAETGNMAAGNAGPILYTDFINPLAVLGLLLLQRLTRRAPAA